MKITGRTSILSLVLLFLITSVSPSLKAQSNTIIAVLDSATFEAQLEFIHERTRVYNDFRAIREDVFLKMKLNAIDTLRKEKLEVARLNSELSERNFQIVTLNTDLSRTKNERDQSIRTKDSFVFLGIQMQKGVYNTIMWIIVLGLLSLGIILFLMFKRSFVVTSQTKHELENIQNEYEEHKKSSREKYEKLVVSHHNDIMRMKKL
jgi:hypothetical protein